MKKSLNTWTQKNYLQIGIYNIVLLILVLLYTAGYFHPFFPLTINFLMLCALVLGILLFKLSSKTIFLIAIFFLVVAMIMSALKIRVWADRTGIYVMQAFVVGFILFVLESLREVTQRS